MGCSIIMHVTKKTLQISNYLLRSTRVNTHRCFVVSAPKGYSALVVYLFLSTVSHKPCLCMLNQVMSTGKVSSRGIKIKIAYHVKLTCSKKKNEVRCLTFHTLSMTETN